MKKKYLVFLGTLITAVVGLMLNYERITVGDNNTIQSGDNNSMTTIYNMPAEEDSGKVSLDSSYIVPSDYTEWPDDNTAFIRTMKERDYNDYKNFSKACDLYMFFNNTTDNPAIITESIINYKSVERINDPVLEVIGVEYEDSVSFYLINNSFVDAPSSNIEIQNYFSATDPVDLSNYGMGNIYSYDQSAIKSGEIRKLFDISYNDKNLMDVFEHEADGRWLGFFVSVDGGDESYIGSIIYSYDSFQYSDSEGDGTAFEFEGLIDIKTATDNGASAKLDFLPKIEDIYRARFTLIPDYSCNICFNIECIVNGDTTAPLLTEEYDITITIPLYDDNFVFSKVKEAIIKWNITNYVFGTDAQIDSHMMYNRNDLFVKEDIEAPAKSSNDKLKTLNDMNNINLINILDISFDDIKKIIWPDANVKLNTSEYGSGLNISEDGIFIRTDSNRIITHFSIDLTENSSPDRWFINEFSNKNTDISLIGIDFNYITDDEGWCTIDFKLDSNHNLSIVFDPNDQLISIDLF